MSGLPRFTEARVLAPEGWLELVAEALSPDAGAAFGQASLASDPAPPGHDFVRAFLPAEADTPARRASMTTALARLASTTGARELEGLEISFRPLAAEDWASSWRKDWKPFRLGRLCILPPGDERALRPGEIALRLEPGGAFGTGRHPTTRACLLALQQRLRPGSLVLDAGTGSGILAVAAALLGARQVLAFDADPSAIPYARALAEENAVAGRCEFLAGGFELLDAARGPFDAVLANLYADLLVEHAGRMRASLVPGGWYAFSGCSAAHAGAVRESLSGSGLALERERVRGRWHTFLGSDLPGSPGGGKIREAAAPPRSP